MKAILLLILSLTIALAAEGQPSAPGWEITSTGPVTVAVPKGWRNFDGIQPTMILFRQGDGIGVPFADETGAPLQLGLTVEKFATTTDSTEAVAKKTDEGASADPRLKGVGEAQLSPVVLSDGTEGTLLIREFIKSAHRRSLQMKLIVKDADATVWVISGYIVGGKDSQLPTPSSPLATWLRAHLLSLTMTGKAVDPATLEAAYLTPTPTS